MLSQQSEVMMFDGEPIRLRSVLAVMAGYAVAAAIVIAGTILLTIWLTSSGVTESPQLSGGYLLANLLMSFVAAVAGGWVTGLVARRSPLAHAGALSCLLLVLSLLMALIAWMNPEASRQPVWYPWITAVLGAAGALVGGLLRRGE